MQDLDHEVKKIPPFYISSGHSGISHLNSGAERGNSLPCVFQLACQLQDILKQMKCAHPDTEGVSGETDPDPIFHCHLEMDELLKTGIQTHRQQGYSKVHWQVP